MAHDEDITEYDVGDVARLRAVFTDDAGAAVTPGEVTFRVKAPDGTTTTVPNEATVMGTYEALVEVTAPGRWRYRVASTGAGQAAGEGEFLARTPQVD